MIDRTLAMAALLATTAAGAQTTPVPHVETRNGHHALIVDGASVSAGRPPTS